MKLGISNIAWDSEDNFKIYELMRNKKIYGLEIAPTKFFPENPYSTIQNKLDILKNSIQLEELEIMSMQSILFGKSDLVLFGDKVKRKELLDYLKLGVIFAKNLGIKNIVFGNPKNRISNSENDWNSGIDFFKELGNFASANNVTIGIEANPDIYGGNFITTTEEAIDFVLECNSEGIGLNLDLGTMIQNNEKLEILDKIDIEKISHVHISEPYLNLISEDNCKLHKELFQYLKNKNYKNYISIEMKYIEEDNFENIERTLDYVVKLKKEVEHD
ncbi:MAG: sugar phosphate isomerase/epimerase family protein [Fusobacteriaceae bacterium]